MQIKIPMTLVRAADRLGDWLNVPLCRIEIRRIDPLLVLGGVLAIAYGYWTGGWWGALGGLLMYILGGMVGLWFF